MVVTQEIIMKAWRDEDFFESLEFSVQKQIPANPAGENALELMPIEQKGYGRMSLLNDDCSMTIIGPHGC